MKNKKIRQMFALTLTGVMLCTLPVCAAEPAENTETAETAEMQSPDSAKTETSVLLICTLFPSLGQCL